MESNGENGMIVGGKKMKKKYRVRVDGREYEVEVEGVEGEKVEAEKKGEAAEGHKEVGRGRAQTRKGPVTTATKGKTVCAPMPARVVKINCRAGGSVKRGELLMTIEAMKMENEVLSPIDGVVKEVCVVEGSSVLSEERLVVFE